MIRIRNFAFLFLCSAVHAGSVAHAAKLGCFGPVVQKLEGAHPVVESLPDLGLVDRSTSTLYAVIDRANQDFEVHGRLNSEGSLSFAIRTVSSDGRVRSAALRGAEQFVKLLKHFEGRVKSVQGFWIYGDNLAAINKFVNPPYNLSLEEAAMRTWTGQQSARAGFTRVKVNTEETKGRRSLFGGPMKYESVSVVFERAETSEPRAR
jgi:hypothetical protein